MNLDNIMKEGNVNDLEWMDETETFNPSNMGLTSEEQMKLQWDKDLKPENKEKIVKRKVNELLNDGAMGTSVISSVRKVFAKENIPKDIRKYVRARSGAVGTVLVDCSVLEDSGDYKKSKKGSRFQEFHQYAINCTCDHKVTSSLQENNVTGKGNIDGFMNTEIVEVDGTRVCAKTGLHVLEKMANYSSEDATDILAKLVKLDYVTIDEEKELLLKNTPLVAVKKAFNMIVNNKIAEEEAKYAGEVDNTAYAVEESGLVAEAIEEVVAPKVSGIKEKSLVADLEKEADNNVDVKISKKENSLDAVKPEEMNEVMDVKISKKRKELDYEKLAELDNEALDVDATPTDTEVDLEDTFEPVEVDTDEYVDEEWFEKDNMDVTANSKDDFEYLEVEENSKFDF